MLGYKSGHKSDQLPTSVSFFNQHGRVEKKIADLDKTSEVVVWCSNIFIGDKHVLKNRLNSYDNTWSWDQLFK